MKILNVTTSQHNLLHVCGNAVLCVTVSEDLQQDQTQRWKTSDTDDPDPGEAYINCVLTFNKNVLQVHF